MPSLRYTIPQEFQDLRLDVALSRISQGDLSRRRIRSIIDLGGCYLNGHRLRVASRLVKAGDKVLLEYREGQTAAELTDGAPALTVEQILFQGAGLVAINKPAGVPSQATRQQAVFHVLPLLEKYLRGAGKTFASLHLLHRLDRDTSGVMLIALDRKAADFVGRQFQEYQVGKVYHALCVGACPAETWIVQEPLSPIDRETGRVVIEPGGREAITEFHRIAEFSEFGISLISCHPRTGRSHQIRVHLEHCNLPILGDRIYGRDKQRQVTPHLKELARRQMLHASSLAFKPSPRMEIKVVEAPYEGDFRDCLSFLRGELSESVGNHKSPR